MNHTTTKLITLPVAGAPSDFRLTKLDAFSGASLLRLLLKHLPENADAATLDQILPALFTALPDAELHALMALCLSHAEMKLDAGYVKVYANDFWNIPELEYDPAACLRLTLEVALFSLEGFFGESGSPSGAAPRNT